MNMEIMQTEADAIIRQAYEAIDHSWERRATVRILDSFEFVCNSPLPATYAKNMVIERHVLQGGSCRHEFHRLGRGAAIKLNQVISEVASSGPVVVTFVFSKFPKSILTAKQNGSVEVHAYHIFGVSREAKG